MATPTQADDGQLYEFRFYATQAQLDALEDVIEEGVNSPDAKAIEKSDPDIARENMLIRLIDFERIGPIDPPRKLFRVIWSDARFPRVQPTTKLVGSTSREALADLFADLCGPNDELIQIKQVDCAPRCSPYKHNPDCMATDDLTPVMFVQDFS